MAVHTSVRSFRIAVTKRVKESTEERPKQIVRATGLYAIRNLIFGTRVDTARARGNWQVTLGDPAEGYDPDVGDISGNPREEGRGVPSRRRDALKEGEAVVMDAGFDLIWMHNGVPYIGILEQKDKMLAGTVEAIKTWLASQRSRGRL